MRGKRAPDAEDWFLSGGIAVALAGAALAADDVRQAFDGDLGGLSAFERAAVGLWDLPPVGIALMAVGVVPAVRAVRWRFPERRAPTEAAARVTATIATIGAVFACVILALCLWMVAAGGVETDTGIRFEFTPGDRGVTLLLQVAGYLPLGLLLAVGAWLASHDPRDEADPVESQEQAPASLSTARRSSGNERSDAIATPRDEVVSPATPSGRAERLWAEQLAFSPAAGEARAILEELRRHAAAGDEDGATSLLAELERLAGRGEA